MQNNLGMFFSSKYYNRIGFKTMMPCMKLERN